MIKIIKNDLKNELNKYIDCLSNIFSEMCLQFELIDVVDDYSISIIEVIGNYRDKDNPDESNEFLLLRFYINYKDMQVHISNIFIPSFMKYKGIGKKIIYKIFEVSEKHFYELFLVDMVESFYWKMINRGALPCEDYDTVKIVSTTKLL